MKTERTRSTRILVSAMLVSGLLLAGCSDDDDSDQNGEEVADVDEGADSDGDSSDIASMSLDVALFADGALQSSDIVECELSDGTVTQCYELVTTGAAKSTDIIGPFCPQTTSSSSDEAGVWLDGTTLYEADGNFILDLPNLYGQSYPPAEEWIFHDEAGNVRITDTLEACQAAARPDVDPAYYGYCVQCELSLIEDDLSRTFQIPVSPQAADAPGQLSADAGISLNGFQIAAQAPVEDILSSYTIAAFDDCGGHVNPNDGYHYHAATGAEGCNSAGTEEDGHPALIGYAMDGYGIYGPLDSGDEEIDLLDECGGAEDDIRGYHYHAASAEQNEHIACFHGKTVAGDDPPPGGGPPAG